MKYTVEYCKNNKVAIFVDNEKDLISLHSTFNIKSPLFTMGVNYFFNFNSKYGYGNGGHYLKDNYELITFQEFMQNQTKKLTEFTDKDVIHCPTEEIANKICKLLHDKGFTWCSGSSYIGHNNWRPYQEETCYLVLKGRYDSKNFYENEGTIHKAEDILALYTVSEEKLPEEYIVECKIVEECNIVASHIKEVDYDCLSVFRYVINSKILGKDSTLYYNIPGKCSHLPILTFQQFQEQIMNIQKIIGYKAPYDLAGGMVKKGTIYKKVQEDDRFYAPEGKISKTTLPKEIVETWEAVFEEEFKVARISEK